MPHRAGRNELKPAQRAALAALNEGSAEELTRGEYQQLTGVSRSQAAYDLAELVDAGLLERLGGGRSTRYRRTRRSQPSHRRWTNERIRGALVEFCAGRTTWPSAGEFKAAGHYGPLRGGEPLRRDSLLGLGARILRDGPHGATAAPAAFAAAASDLGGHGCRVRRGAVRRERGRAPAPGVCADERGGRSTQRPERRARACPTSQCSGEAKAGTDDAAEQPPRTHRSRQHSALPRRHCLGLSRRACLPDDLRAGDLDPEAAAGRPVRVHH